MMAVGVVTGAGWTAGRGRGPAHATISGRRTPIAMSRTAPRGHLYGNLIRSCLRRNSSDAPRIRSGRPILRPERASRGPLANVESRHTLASDDTPAARHLFVESGLGSVTPLSQPQRTEPPSSNRAGHGSVPLLSASLRADGLAVDRPRPSATLARCAAWADSAGPPGGCLLARDHSLPRPCRTSLPQAGNPRFLDLVRHDLE